MQYYNVDLYDFLTKTNFGYDVSSSSGSICNNKTVACNQYVLSAVLEGGSGTF